ncbi:hypothetical protein BGZ60DRAFT_520605 [Tricladium varicosporioides]|nr:hypothetical protein BGZ60DRAFT_520605 [Hymenoscyphus varicosporioides]
MMWKTATLLTVLSLSGQISAFCWDQQPERRICYDVPGATPQNVSIATVKAIANYVRSFGVGPNRQEFYTMEVKKADNCAEWKVVTPDNSSTWLLVKLTGDNDTAVTFNDLASTIDGGENASAAQTAAALLGCGTAGGQMPVAVNASDPAYKSATFVNGKYTNVGILAKIVRIPDAVDFM